MSICRASRIRLQHLGKELEPKRLLASSSLTLVSSLGECLRKGSFPQITCYQVYLVCLWFIVFWKLSHFESVPSRGKLKKIKNENERQSMKWNPKMSETHILRSWLIQQHFKWTAFAGCLNRTVIVNSCNFLDLINASHLFIYLCFGKVWAMAGGKNIEGKPLLLSVHCARLAAVNRTDLVVKWLQMLVA